MLFAIFKTQAWVVQQSEIMILNTKLTLLRFLLAWYEITLLLYIILWFPPKLVIINKVQVWRLSYSFISLE